jgi:hypothetical protein
MSNQHAHSQATQNYASSYNTSKANVNTKITSMNNASSAKQNAKSTFDTAEAAKTNAQNTYTSNNNAYNTANSDFTAKQNAKTATQSDYDAKNTAYNTANSDFTTKQNAKTAADDAKNTAQTNYDAAVTVKNTAQQAVTDAQADYEAIDPSQTNAKNTAQQNLLAKQQVLTTKQQDLTTKTNLKDAAIATQQQKAQELQVITDANTTFQTKKNALDTAISDLQTKQQENASAVANNLAELHDATALANAEAAVNTAQTAYDAELSTNIGTLAKQQLQQNALNAKTAAETALQVITDANTTFQTKKNALDTAISDLQTKQQQNADTATIDAAQAAVNTAQTAYDTELNTNIGTLAKQQLQQNALATKTAAEEAQAKAQAEYDAKIAAEAEAINAYNIAQAQKLTDLTIAKDDAATNQQQHTIYQNNIKNKFQQSTSHFSKNMSKIFDNMTSIVNSDNKSKGLNNNQRINLDEEFFKPTPFFIPLNTIKYNDNNKTFFKIPNSNNNGFIDFEITFDDEKFTIVNNNNITLKPNKTEFSDGERVTLDHTYSLVFDKENGIIDGRNNSQLQEAVDINNMDNANISDFQEKYKKSMKQINQITINANNEASIHQDVFDFINLKSTTEDKLKEVKNTMNNLFLNEDNKDKKKISDVDMSSIFGSSGIDFDENSIFKNVKKLQVYKGGNDYNTNSFTTTDFFGELTDYQDTDFKTKLENGTKKASYGLLSNKDEKMQIKMGTADTDILKTENGFKINDKEYFNGDRYQKNGYTIEFKDGYIVNSVKDNELEMLQTFDTIDRSKLDKMMNCMNDDNSINTNECKLDDFEASFKKAGGVIDDISLNKFRKKMIDVIFDTPDNKDLESFIANNETFLKLDKTKLPEKFQTKTKSLVFKDKTEVKLDIRNEITNDANIYIPTEAGVTGKDEIKFDFKDENLKMKHEIEGTGANKVNKYKFTHETKADTAQESGWTIKKYNTGNKLFEDVPTENTFNKDDVLEIEKNNVKYTIHMGSANIQDIQDTNDYTPIVNKGSKLNNKYHTVKNRMLQIQFTSKGLANAISMSKDKNEELVLTHRYKDTTGDRLRRLKSMHIVNSKLSKS